MKVALYTISIDSTSGKEATIFKIADLSRHNWTIYTHNFNKENTFANFDNLNIIELKDKHILNPLLNQRKLVFNASLRLPLKKIPLSRYDVFMIVSGGVDHFIIFPNKSKTTVCLCLTPLRFLYDQKVKNIYHQQNDFNFIRKHIYYPLFKFFDKKAWQSFNQIICISQEVKKRLIEAKLVSRDNIIILHPGADTKMIKPSWRYDKYFLIAGRINWTKNIEAGIRIFQNFQQSNPENHFELIVAGRVEKNDMPYYQSLKKLSSNDKQIKFVKSPSEQELYDLYQNSYAILFTAMNEDFGIVPIEGMAFGKPIICFNEGGPKETVIHNQTGYLVNNETEFTEALTLLANQPKLTKELGYNARNNALKYDWNIFVEKLDDLLESMIGT
jgi:glycosyltransferase involved in cell wall biosynthesis